MSPVSLGVFGGAKANPFDPFILQSSTSTVANTNTLTGIDLGNPEPGRTFIGVLMTGNTNNSSTVISGVTINGVQAEIDIYTPARSMIIMFRIVLPDGNTGTLNVSGTGVGFSNMFLNLYRTKIPLVPYYMDHTQNPLQVVNEPNHYSLVAGVGGTVDLGGLDTVDYSGNPGESYFSIGRKVVAGVHTISTNLSGDSLYQRCCVMSYGPPIVNPLRFERFFYPGLSLDSNNYDVIYNGSKTTGPYGSYGRASLSSEEGASAAYALGSAYDTDSSIRIDGNTTIRRRWMLHARAQEPLVLSATGLSDGYTFLISNDLSPAQNGLCRNGSLVAGLTKNVSINAIQMMRLLVEQNWIRCKFWEVDLPEPEGWDIEYYDPNPLPMGRSGFGSFNSGNRMTYFIGPHIVKVLG